MPDPSPDADVAADIVQKIIQDLRDRSGLDEAWDSIDQDIQDEIASAWVRIARDRLRAHAPFVSALLRQRAHAAQACRCEGWYVDSQGARRSCLAGAEGCGLLGCAADHGPEGMW